MQTQLASLLLLAVSVMIRANDVECCQFGQRREERDGFPDRSEHWTQKLSVEAVTQRSSSLVSRLSDNRNPQMRVQAAKLESRLLQIADSEVILF